MTEKTKAWISITSCGVILANLIIASSRTFGNFAPFPITLAWLNAAAFVCGFTLGIALERASFIFSGVFLMALIAVLVFSGVLVWVVGTTFLDIVLLFAFQQSFPRFVFIGILGFVGAVSSVFLKLRVGQL
jgi:hypothetical protein